MEKLVEVCGGEDLGDGGDGKGRRDGRLNGTVPSSRDGRYTPS